MLWNTYVLLCLFFPALANHSLCFSSSQKPRNSVVFVIPPSFQRIQITHIHTCMQADIHVHIPCVSVWHVVQNTVHVATSQHPGGEETSICIQTERGRGSEEGRGREGESFPTSSFFVIPPSLSHIPPSRLLFPSFHLLPILHSPPMPIAILTAWDCLTPLRHISPVIIVSTNRESRLTSTGVVSILGEGGWIMSAFGFEAILVASSCSSNILGRLK